MSDEINEALKTPYKKVKDADREIEYLSTDELLKRKRVAKGGKRPLFRQVTVSRTRDL